MSRYKALLNKIEKLNEKNVKGYKTFKEYVLSDEIMISYFKDLKKLEKKFSKLHVDSYETFERHLYEQLKEIYDKMLSEIYKNTDEQKINIALINFQNDIDDSHGHGCDYVIDKLLNDLKYKIKNTSNVEIDKTSEETKTIEEKTNEVKKRASGELIFNDEMKLWIDENFELFHDNYKYYENNCCPNCGVVLDSKIKSSRNCSSCKKKIICRTNKETGRKLLLTDNQLGLYEKNDEKRKDILFFEKQMKSLSNSYPDYMYYFWNLKREKPDMSTRDYTWCFENWLMNTLDCELIREYQKDLKLSFQDRVLKCDQHVFALTHVSYIYDKMISIAKYKGKDDVAEEMMLSLIYRSVELAHLYYYHWEDRPFSEIQFYSDASFGMHIVKEYLEENNLRFEDLKDLFFERAHSFVLNVLTKEDAWPILCEAYKRYIYLVEHNEFYREK